MTSFADVARIVRGLPDTGETTKWGNQTWTVHAKSFVWVRPFTSADVRRFGDAPVPDGPILAAYVEDLDTKGLVIAAEPEVFFTIEHFQGFRAVLMQLDRLDLDRLEEVLTEAWLVRAPKRMAAQWIKDHPETGSSPSRV